MKRVLTPQQLTAWQRFITAHSRIITVIDNTLEKTHNIPLNWYDVLIELYEAPGQRLKMSVLAERVLLTRSGLTRLINRLVEQDYITREPDPDDGRGSYAVLTNAGVQAMREAWPVYEQAILSLFVDHLTEDNLQVLSTALQDMINGTRSGGQKVIELSGQQRRGKLTDPVGDNGLADEVER